MTEALVQKIIKKYGFEPVEILPAKKGYRNESTPVVCGHGEIVNLILYKDEKGIVDKIKSANSVSSYLADEGFPVRTPITDQILRLKQPNGNYRYACLYSYLPGHTIPWEAYTMKHLKLLGKTMSDMHAGLAAYRDKSQETRVKSSGKGHKTAGHCVILNSFQDLPKVTEEYQTITARMKRYFANPNVRKALAEKLNLSVDPRVFTSFHGLLEQAKKLPDQQPLHMDFVRSNILFDNNEDSKLIISGIIDFEKAAVGPPVFDIARTLAFLLVDCKYKQPEKIIKYFLCSGYNKRGAADFTVRHSRPRSGRGQATCGNPVNNDGTLESLINLFLFYDFYKFLHHNPYESLHKNEHFTRTQDQIVKSHLVRASN